MSYDDHLISMAGGDGDEEPEETVRNETYDYGRLWPDGTFNKIGWSDEKAARREFDEKGHELKSVPKSLRPIFSRQRVVTTTEIYTAEALPEPTP
jgi:hypothetical protein